jgi:hypothetical protein
VVAGRVKHLLIDTHSGAWRSPLTGTERPLTAEDVLAGINKAAPDLGREGRALASREPNVTTGRRHDAGSPDVRWTKGEKGLFSGSEPGPGGAEGEWTFAHGGPGGERWQQVAEEARQEILRANPRFKAESTKLRDDLDKAMADAEKHQDMRDWYGRHRPLAKELFGADEPLFEKFLAAASAGLTGRPNVDEGLRAMNHHMLGGRFDDGSYHPAGMYAKSTLSNYVHIQKGEDLSGKKVPSFYQNLIGHSQYVTGDRWMARVLFQSAKDWHAGEGFTMNKAQQIVMGQVVTAFARRMHWEPSGMQAALWAVAKGAADKGNSKNVWDYKQYLMERRVAVAAMVAGWHKHDEFVDAPVSIAMQRLLDAYQNGAMLLAMLERLKVQVGDAPTVDTVARLIGTRADAATQDQEEVNILTAGDDLVCNECNDVADAGPYDIDEAETMLPIHINCRCSWVPVLPEGAAGYVTLTAAEAA